MQSFDARQLLPALAAAGVGLGLSLLIYSHFESKDEEEKAQRQQANPGQAIRIKPAPRVPEPTQISDNRSDNAGGDQDECKYAHQKDKAEQYACLSPRCSRFYKTEEGMRDHMRDSKKCRRFATWLKHNVDKIKTASTAGVMRQSNVGISHYLRQLPVSNHDIAIGTGKTSNEGDDQFDRPRGLAFVSANPDWIVISGAFSFLASLRH
jgi:hypothetical protein